MAAPRFWRSSTFPRFTPALARCGVVDLVGIMGYYALIAMSLNIFEEPLPDGVAPPLDP